MVSWLRRPGSWRAGGTGGQALASTIGDIGEGILEMEEDDLKLQYNADKAGYDVSEVTWDNDINEWLNANMDEPSKALERFEADLAGRKKSILSVSDNDRIKEELGLKFDVDAAKKRGYITTWINEQNRRNEKINYQSAFNAAKESKIFMPGNAGLQQLTQSFIGFADTQSHFADTQHINGIPDSQFKEDFREVATKQIESYLLQHGTEEQINNPNAFVKEFSEYGFDRPLFDADEIAELKKDYQTRKDNAKRIDNEQRYLRHDKNGRDFLSRLWDDDPNNQPTPQEIAEAIRPDNDLITESMGKYLMDNLGDTSAKETDLGKLSIVNDALLDYQLNSSPESKQKALETIAENAKYLSKPDAKSKLNELYADISRIDAAERKEAYSDMAQLLGGTPDLFSVDYTFGNSKEKDAWILAKILWDEEIKKAADAGKPLDRLKKRYAAIRIARQLNQEMRTKTGEELLVVPEETEEKGQRMDVALGLQDIWEELNEQERRTAMKALTLGKSPQEIIEYFNRNK